MKTSAKRALTGFGINVAFVVLFSTMPTFSAIAAPYFRTTNRQHQKYHPPFYPNAADRYQAEKERQRIQKAAEKQKAEQREREARERIEQTRKEAETILSETKPLVKKSHDSFSFATTAIRDWSESSGKDIPQNVKDGGAKYRDRVRRLEAMFENCSGMLSASDSIAAEILRQASLLKSEAAETVDEGNNLCLSVLNLFIDENLSSIGTIAEELKPASSILAKIETKTPPDVVAELQQKRRDLLRRREEIREAIEFGDAETRNGQFIGTGLNASLRREEAGVSLRYSSVYQPFGQIAEPDWPSKLQKVAFRQKQLAVLRNDVDSFLAELSARE